MTAVASGVQFRATGTEDHLHLFATASYNRRNLQPGQEYLRVDLHETGRLIGTFVGIVEDGTFWSGFRAPFCGPDFGRQRETPKNVAALVAETLGVLRDNGVSKVKVKARPASYSSNEAYVQHALLQCGLGVVTSELSFGINLSRCFDAQDYVGTLKREARRAIRYAEAEPFEYREAQTEAEWATAYELVRLNRAAKGNPLGLSLDYVLGLRDDFGDRIRFFVLFHSNTPVASALLYRLLPDVELVEYWGDHHELDRSPMNRLAYEVCARGIDEGVRLIDLGLSSVNGRPDEGLIQFKQSIGASAELRLDFEGRP